MGIKNNIKDNDQHSEKNYVTFLEELSSEELELFEKALKDGAVHKYVERKKEFYKIKEKTCPVCGNFVTEECFVLIFGEPSIRKKAHFCGIDCLDYFLHKNLMYKKEYDKTNINDDNNKDKLKKANTTTRTQIQKNVESNKE